MKKMALAMAVFMAVTIFSLPAYAKEVPITEENVAQLKGKWEGKRLVDRSLTTHRREELFTEIRFFNDVIPLKGETIREGLPSFVSDSYKRKSFDNGVIKEGKVLIKWDKFNWIRLSLFSEYGKLKLRGKWVYYEIPLSGTSEIILEKVE